MSIQFTLQETMDRHGITQYALGKASGVRNNTIQGLREGNAKSLTVEKLNALVAGLNTLTGEKYGLDAVMIYVEDSE